MAKYDIYLKRFSLTYPHVIGSLQFNLWNFHKYGISNWRHLKKTALHDLSARAEELGVLPDATEIVKFYIAEVTAEYADREPVYDEEGTGTLESLVDIAEARNSVRQRINPFMKRPLEEADFQEVIDRFTKSESSDPEEAEGGQRETGEEEKRLISFSQLVLESCSGNYKTGRGILEELISIVEKQWDPRIFEFGYFVTGTIEFDNLVRTGPQEPYSSVQKIPIEILDFDTKYVGQYGIIPHYQWSKQFIYNPGHERFVFLERKEKDGVEKGLNDVIGQTLIIKIRIPNFQKLYPYIYDVKSLEYDGPISKTNLLDKWVYQRQFPMWIYKEDAEADSTTVYSVQAVTV